MKKFVLTYIILLITVIGGAGQATRYGASFLELGVGARALGMGSAYVALSDDASGISKYCQPKSRFHLKCLAKEKKAAIS